MEMRVPVPMLHALRRVKASVYGICVPALQMRQRRLREVNCLAQDHRAVHRSQRQVPKSYKSSYVTHHLFAYSPASPYAAHRAQRAEADSQDGPALTELTV